MWLPARGADVSLPLLDDPTVDTVDSRRALYTRRENKAADLYRDFQAGMAFSSDTANTALLKRVTNAPITSRAIAFTRAIYGPSVPACKGKSTHTHPPHYEDEPTTIPPMVGVVYALMCDILFIQLGQIKKALAFFLSVVYPVGHTILTYLPRGKSATELLKAIRQQLGTLQSHNKAIGSIHMDGESGIRALEPILNGFGIKLHPRASGEHVPEVERKVRTVKERVRSVIHSLAFKLARVLLVALALFCVGRVNWCPTKALPDQASPNEWLLGRHPDWRRDHMDKSFGSHFEVTVPATSNDMSSRTHTALFVGATGNAHGTAVFFNVETQSLFRSSTFTGPIPLSAQLIARLNALHAADRLQVPDDPAFTVGTTTIDSPDPHLADGPVAPPARDPPGAHAPLDVDPLGDFEPPRAPELAPDFTPLGNLPAARFTGVPVTAAEASDDQPQPLTEVAPAHRGGTADTDTPIIPYSEPSGPPDTQSDGPSADFDDAPALDDPPPAAPDAAAPPTPQRTSPASRTPQLPAEPTRRSTRIKEPLPYKSYGQRALNLVTKAEAKYFETSLPLHAHVEGGYVFQMTTKRAERLHGYAAIKAHVKEVKQILDRSVLRPVYWDTLSRQQKANLIRSHTVFKDKYDPVTGEFVKIKARTVVNGSQQDRSRYDDVSSPTVSHHSVFLGAGIAALERRRVKTADFPGAYLNGVLPAGIDVHVVLDELSAAILVQLQPEYEPYLRPDRTMICKLDKALYGLIESARIWFLNVSETLLKMGFRQNPKDICVFNKDIDGNQLTIFLYVDDILLTCKDVAAIDGVLAELKAIYGELVVHEGSSLPYLGMEFDFSQPGQVSVKMGKYIDDLLRITETTGTADTPAGESLFSTRDAQKLDPEQARDFHSHVATVLYLAKRARPDLLTAVSFLTRRVAEPDVDDLKKLQRLLRYINATRDLPLVIRPDQGLQVHAYVDASYAVHEDFRSHTGTAITIGGGATYAKSSVQKLNTKSSTESELVGASDSCGHILWTRDWLIHQGYTEKPAILHQDNQSTMALISKGYSTSDKTRHINIRYFFIKDRVDAGELEVRYCPTEEMLADLLTKPLQGEQFAKLRDRLLGLTGAAILLMG